jgi:hypothetical protein
MYIRVTLYCRHVIILWLCHLGKPCSVFVLICTMVVLHCFVMYGCVGVCVCVGLCVWVCVCGCGCVCVGVGVCGFCNDWGFS